MWPYVTSAAAASASRDRRSSLLVRSGASRPVGRRRDASAETVAESRCRAVGAGSFAPGRTPRSAPPPEDFSAAHSSFFDPNTTRIRYTCRILSRNCLNSCRETVAVGRDAVSRALVERARRTRRGMAASYTRRPGAAGALRSGGRGATQSARTRRRPRRRRAPRRAAGTARRRAPARLTRRRGRRGRRPRTSCTTPSASCGSGATPWPR